MKVHELLEVLKQCDPEIEIVWEAGFRVLSIESATLKGYKNTQLYPTVGYQGELKLVLK